MDKKSVPVEMELRSELWSIGVTLYEVATGKQPFVVPGGRKNKIKMFVLSSSLLTMLSVNYSKLFHFCDKVVYKSDLRNLKQKLIIVIVVYAIIIVVVVVVVVSITIAKLFQRLELISRKKAGYISGKVDGSSSQVEYSDCLPPTCWLSK